ncbi:divisome protein SepX/GlpR [Nocardia jiangxiensis]|uniref:divisome protein SepX/GlpR n=1 Tax=Nocardia jiangxiensis TaxID=282685 RepID=UPI0002DB1494|nr:gephyrin-like molybdotransferase receptor GlpR [Nocardia jiangxiensis]
MPNSILWVGLVVLWVFVLFPMLAARYPRIRRTTDTALATRVLHRGDSRRRAKSGPASGHDSDPDWVPIRAQRRLLHGDDAEDRMTTSADEPVTEHDDSSETGAGGVGGSEVIEAEVDELDEAEFGGVDGADISGEDAGAAAAEVADAGADVMDDSRAAEDEPAPMSARIPPARTVSGSRRATDLPEAEEVAAAAAEAELLEDESDSGSGRFVPNRRGRGGYDPEADAVARAARYRYRQRMTLALALSALLFGGFGLAVSPLLWWGCGLSALVLAGYLFYLRRQVRFEEEIRRRRSSRLSGGARPARARDSARAADPDLGRDDAHDLRRRAVVMDIDDEDPAFDFLETFDAAAARATRARAAGGEIPRAAGE